MRKSTIAMLVALSFAAVSCGGTKEETTEEVATEVVEVEATEEVVEVEATEEVVEAEAVK